MTFSLHVGSFFHICHISPDVAVPVGVRPGDVVLAQRKDHLVEARPELAEGGAVSNIEDHVEPLGQGLDISLVLQTVVAENWMVLPPGERYVGKG
jgi:hypothetical protein